MAGLPRPPRLLAQGPGSRPRSRPESLVVPLVRPAGVAAPRFSGHGATMFQAVGVGGLTTEQSALPDSSMGVGAWCVGREDFTTGFAVP